MNTFLLVAISFLAPVYAIYVSISATYYKLILSPGILYVALHTIFIHIAAIDYFLYDPEDNVNFILGSSLGLIFFSFGQTLALSYYRRSRLKKLFSWPTKMINDLKGSTLLKWNIFLFTAIIMSFLFLYIGFQRSGQIPFLNIFKEDSQAYQEARLNFYRYSGAVALYQFYGVIMPTISVGYLLRFLITNRKKDKIIAMIIIIFTSFCYLAPGHRGPIMIYIIIICIALSYYYNNIPKERLIIVSLLSFFILYLLTYGGYITDNEKEYSNILAVLYNRIFKVQAIGPQFMYSMIPNSWDYFYGTTFTLDLFGIGKGESFSSIIPKMRVAKSQNNPIGCMTEFYINFGYIGIIVFTFLWGIVCHIVHIKMMAGSRKITDVAIKSTLIFCLSYATIAGFIGIFFQYGLVTLALMLIIMKL